MTLIDWIALFLFFTAWLGYGPLLKLIARRSGSLNDDMLIVRDSWMTAMTHREMRLIDSQLMGHSINSASFFASTNLLLIAAVAGILFGGENALKGFAAVGAEAVPMKILEAKLVRFAPLEVPADVIDFLARTVTRNVRELVGGLNKLIAYAQLTG